MIWCHLIDGILDGWLFSNGAAENSEGVVADVLRKIRFDLCNISYGTFPSCPNRKGQINFVCWDDPWCDTHPGALPGFLHWQHPVQMRMCQIFIFKSIFRVNNMMKTTSNARLLPAPLVAEQVSGILDPRSATKHNAMQCDVTETQYLVQCNVTQYLVSPPVAFVHQSATQCNWWSYCHSHWTKYYLSSALNDSFSFVPVVTVSGGSRNLTSCHLIVCFNRHKFHFGQIHQKQVNFFAFQHLPPPPPQPNF